MSINEILKSTLSSGLEKKNQSSDTKLEQSEVLQDSQASTFEQPKELGGRIGPDPTRYGDWEKNGRCIDF